MSETRSGIRVEKGRFDPYSLGKEASERWDYFISDEIVYAAEIRNGKVPWGQKGYIKDYIEGRLWLEFVAHGVSDQKPKLIWIVESCTDGVVSGRDREGGIRSDRSDDSMLVVVTQFPDDAEKFILQPLRSIVRLKLVDSIPTSFREKFDFPEGQTKAGSIGGLGPIHVNGEADLPLLLSRESGDVFFATLHGESPGDVIKRGAQVAEDVAHDQSPVKPNSRVDGVRMDARALNHCPWNTAHRLQFVLSSEGDIWLSRGTTDSRIQGIDVYVRPISFELGAAKWMPGGVKTPSHE